MKYYVVFGSQAEPVPTLSTAPAFDTFEAAQAFLKERAQKNGNTEAEYGIRCGEQPGCLTECSDAANPKQAYGDKKLPTHLVPPALVLEAAPNMRDGAAKYGPYNWRSKKVEVMTYVAAIQRHLSAFIDGEDVDPESKSGATHLGAIAACVGIIADARNMGNLIDNRPPRGSAGDVIRRAAGVDLTKKDPP